MENGKKKILLILIVLTVLLALIVIVFVTGREKPPEDIGEDPPEDAITFDPSVPGDEPVYSGSNLSSSPFVGEFTNSYLALFQSLAEDYFGSEEEIPRLSVTADGSFTLTVNAMEAGMLAVRGTVSVDGETAVCTVTERPSVEFFGDSVESFRLALVNENDLRYDGEQIGTVTGGDLFSRFGG